MFYRLFRKPNAPRSVSTSNNTSFSTSSTATPGHDAATAATNPMPSVPAAAPGDGAPLPGASNALHANGASNNDGGNAGDGSDASGSVQACVDRRAFQGEERLLERPHASRRYPLDPERDAALLVLLTQQYSITSVVITHHRVKENYVEYVIECVRGHDAWRVYRRYQQFKTLDHELKQLCSGRHGSNHGPYGVVPVLPGSHWMDVTNQSPELVEQRRRYLEIYLQQLLVVKNLFYVARTSLFDFLHDGEVPTHLKLTGIQPLLGLISTRTDFVDCDDDDDNDDAIQREQEAHQQSDDAQGAGEVASGSVHALPASPVVVTVAPAATVPPSIGDNPLSSVATSSGGDTAKEHVTDEHKGDIDTRRQQFVAATRIGVSSSPERSDNSSAPVSAATGAAQASGEREMPETLHHEADAEEGPEEEEEPGHAKNHTHASLVDGAPFSAPDTLQLSFTDERLPPASANCAQCNAEFNSFLYPHRCFFCRVQFCSACLQKLPLFEGLSAPGSGAALAAASAVSAAAGRELMRSPLQTNNAASDASKPAVRSVFACRQCAENYNRRLDRCGTAPGGGAYRGMQSTLAPPAASSSGSSSSHASPVTTSPTVVSPAACVGEERTSMLSLQKRNTGIASPSLRVSPSGSFAGRNGSMSAIGFQDFQLLTVIGRGTFGKVLKVQRRSTGKVYAMKIMNKATVYKRCMTSYMKEEKSILTSMKPHPYIVRCYYAFQTDYYLVFVMDYLPGGELYDYLYPKLRLSPEAACFYAAELVLALEHLHRQDVVHRDLKPENVVLTVDGHLCLTDFGLARRAFSRSRRRSFVGSPEYVAPETIQGQVQTAAVDWWSFGIMLYEMLAGHTPFHARNNNTVYDNVLHKELKLQVKVPSNPPQPTGGDVPSPSARPATRDAAAGTAFTGFSAEAAALLSGLLARDPTMRLQDATVIKRHPFFRGIDWEALKRKGLAAPCIPGDLRDNDVRHFKREFVSEWASVPPLRTMTRTSIDALTKCFENFPISRQPSSTSTSSPQSVSPSPQSSTASPSTHHHYASSSSGSHLEARGLSPSLTLLPPSVLSADGRTLREPVHFARSAEEARRCFHGMWRLVSVEVHALDDGRVIFPWGGEVSGLLLYSSEGLFSMQLTPTARRPMGPVQRVGQLSKEDLCDTYCSYVASFGRFRLFPSSADDGCGVVRHFAEGNLCPNLTLANTVFQYRMDVEPLSGASAAGKTKKVSPVPPSQGAGVPQQSKSCTLAAVGMPPKPTRVPSTCDSEASADARGSQDGTTGSMGAIDADRTAPFDEAAAAASADSRPISPLPPPASSSSSSALPSKRYVLRLSTRPQRAIDEDFMAFTSLVFQKIA